MRETADIHVERVRQYRAKAERRPFLYWWHAFLLLGVTVLMWKQLPLAAVVYEVRVSPPLPEPRSAYVTLDPEAAAQAFKKSLTAWSMGGVGGVGPSGLDLGGIDLGVAQQAPEYLGQGARYPGVWQPSAVEPLALALPEVRLAEGVERRAAALLPVPQSGISMVRSAALEKAGFAVSLAEDPTPERSGLCRFYVETGADGRVEHVLLLSQRTLGAALFERVLLRGRAAGAAQGFVDISWFFPKS